MLISEECLIGEEAKCNEAAYLLILHLAREQLRCTQKEKLSLLNYN